MEAKGQLQRLLRIQELSNSIRKAQHVVEQAPRRVEEVENRFRERNAEYVALKDRNDELIADQDNRSQELTTLEEKRKKFMDDLMQVKNQREYSAMLREIDAVKAQISEHEEAVLKDMEEIEKLKDELAQQEENIKEDREASDRERAEVESEAEQARESIERLSAERDQVESELPRSLLPTLRKLEQTRQGTFLSKAENGVCLSCFVRVRPQVFQEIKQATAVHTCGNCRRFLYHEPSLRPEPEAAAPSEGVEAVNGGAV